MSRKVSAGAPSFDLGDLKQPAEHGAGAFGLGAGLVGQLGGGAAFGHGFSQIAQQDRNALQRGAQIMRDVGRDLPHRLGGGLLLGGHSVHPHADPRQVVARVIFGDARLQLALGQAVQRGFDPAYPPGRVAGR